MCESDEWCRYALERLWPGVPVFPDIRALSVDALRERGAWPIDIISGGFPCQDISSAGKGVGITGERSALWFEMLRLVREVRPRWVLAENVPALRTRGADIVLDGLAAAGYTAWPVVVGAWACGASHRRNRVWIVGHANSDRAGDNAERTLRDGERIGSCADGGRADEQHGADCAGADVADSEGGDGGLLLQQREPRQAGIESERGRETLEDPLRVRGDVPEGRERVSLVPVSGVREVQKRDCIAGDVPHSPLLGCGPRRPESGGLSGPWRWPLGPGAEQHEWEWPRVLAHGSAVNGERPIVGRDRCRRSESETGESGGGPTQPALGRATDGLPGAIPTSARRALLRTLGNSLVPQIPYLLYRWIVRQEGLA